MTIKEWFLNLFKEESKPKPEPASEDKEVWWILSYRQYIDGSYGGRTPSIQFTAASSKKKSINRCVFGCTLTKEQVLWYLRNDIPIKGWHD